MKIIGWLLFFAVLWAGFSLGGFAGLILAFFAWVGFGVMLQIRN
jgi:hypothetical protein